MRGGCDGDQPDEGTGSGLESLKQENKMAVPAKRGQFFYGIGNFVPCTIKTLRGDAHSREDVVCRKRLRSAQECAKAHSFLEK